VTFVTRALPNTRGSTRDRRAYHFDGPNPIMRNMIRYLAGAIALVASLAAAASPQLIVPYTGSVPKSEKAKPFKSTGTRIRFNAQQLANLVPGQEVELTLPDGATHTVVFDLREDKGQGITTWVGHYKDAAPLLRTIITTGPGGSYGRIVTPDNEYSIVPGEGFDWLVDMNAEKPFMPKIDLRGDARVPKGGKPKSSLTPQGATPESIDLVPGVNSAAVAKSAAAISTPSGVVVDILVAYTSGLAADLGANLQTRIQQLATSANTIFADSGVGIFVRVVGTVQVNYSDTANDSAGALFDITPGVQDSGTDPGGIAAAFGNIENLRTQAGADMVTLLRDGDGFGGDGIAWVGGSTPDAQYMYSVMTGCTASCDWVWVHELGHNFGSAHDRATNAWENNGANIPGAYSYSYGYYSCSGGRLALSCAAFSGGCTGGEPECSAAWGNDFSDIMAYFQGSTTKNMVFSNPSLLTCKGDPNAAGAACGSAVGNSDEANAALTLNNTRVAVSGLYPSKTPYPTTTIVTSSANPSASGQSVTFTAAVTSPAGTPATGTVSFTSDATPICSGIAVNSSGQATCPVSSLSAATHSIVAQYSGASAYATSSSAPFSQVVTAPVKVNPAITVSASANPADQDKNVTFTASVGGTNGTATGSVTFMNGGTTLCGSVALSGGTAACTKSSLAPGPFTVTASYGGSSAYNAGSGSTSITVRAATTTTVALSANPALSGQPVTATATLSSATAGTFTGTLNMLVDGAVACSLLPVSGPAVSCSLPGVAVGDHTVVAQYGGSSTYGTSASAPATLSVRLASAIALATSATPANSGQVVTFTATVTGPGAAPSGSVVFKDASTTINGCGNASVWNGVAKCMTSALAAGPHSITAAYGGDTTYTAVASSALAQSISSTVQPPGAGKRLDFNGDGKADIVWQGTDGSVSLWLMDGVSIAARGPVFGASAGAVVRSGDFNGDGKADFVRQLADGSTTITLMNGLDVLSTTALRAATTARLMNVGDFNGDGVTDLLWKNADNSWEMWLTNPGSAPTVATIMQAGTGWSVAKIGDFNGDGRDDLIWANIDGSNSMWLMSGSTILQRGPLLPAGSPWRAAWIGDVNGDGNDDILWRNALDGSVSVWMMNGLATVQRGPLMGANSGQSVALVGDFDGDHKTDIVWRGADGSVTLWTMNGLSWTPSTLFAAGAPWVPSQATDANGDGKADFLWTRTDGTVGLWLMSGGAMIDHRSVMAATPSWSIATTVEQNR